MIAALVLELELAAHARQPLDHDAVATVPERPFRREVVVEAGHVLDDDRRLAAGQPIEDYPDATPYPSRLMLGWCGSRPLHVVVADNPSAGETIIVTVYEPDPARWEDGFTRRKAT